MGLHLSGGLAQALVEAVVEDISQVMTVAVCDACQGEVQLEWAYPGLKYLLQHRILLDCLPRCKCIILCHFPAAQVVRSSNHSNGKRSWEGCNQAEEERAVLGF